LSVEHIDKILEAAKNIHDLFGVRHVMLALGQQTKGE
jgi:hypothetical protein